MSQAIVVVGSLNMDFVVEVCRRLLALGPRSIILKLGEKGDWLADERSSRHFPVRPVQARDTTAAGDTFNGALAASLAEGQPVERAITFANLAASIAVTRLGAQASIPSRTEVEALIGAPQN